VLDDLDKDMANMSVISISDDSDNDNDSNTHIPERGARDEPVITKPIYRAMANDQCSKDQLADLILGGAPMEYLGNDAFLLKIYNLRLEVSSWCSSWGGSDKFAGYMQLSFYKALTIDHALYNLGDEIEDSDEDQKKAKGKGKKGKKKDTKKAEAWEGPPPYALGHFFSRWCAEMNKKVEEGELLLLRAKNLGGGKLSFASRGGRDNPLLTMSWWKHQFLWTETISIIQELVRGLGKIDATCQLLIHHPDFDFRPSFTWRPPYRMARTL